MSQLTDSMYQDRPAVIRDVTQAQFDAQRGNYQPNVIYRVDGGAMWMPVSGEHVSAVTATRDASGHVVGLSAGGETINILGNMLSGAQYFFGFGDSITANGGRVVSVAGVVDPTVGQYSWPQYAELAADGCAQWGGSFAQGSYTITQLKDNWLPRLISYAPVGSAVIVLMGQNNSGATATELADYTYCIDAMLAAGLVPVLATQTAGTTSRARQIFHNHIAILAASRKLHIVDMHGAIVDEETGVILAAMTYDGIHPNQPGSKALGDAVGPVLKKIFPRNIADLFLAKHDLDYGPNRTTQTGGTTNPLFSDSSAASPDVPTGWSIVSGSHAGAFTYADAAVGRACTINAPASGDMIVRNSSANTVLVGDKCVFSAIITSNVVSGGYARWAISNGNGNRIVDFGRNGNQGGGVSYARSKIVVPFTQITANNILIDVLINGYGTTFTLEQMSIINLTALGLA